MSFLTDMSRSHSEARSFLRAAGSHLTVVAAFVAGSALVVQFGDLPSPVRAVLGIPLVLFAPGYMLVTAAYPGRRTAALGGGSILTAGTEESGPGLGPVERVALAVGLSVAVVPLVGAAVWAAAGALSRGLVLDGLVGVVGLLFPVAVGRRYALAPEERFVTRPKAQIRRVRRWIVGPSPVVTAANVLLVASILLAAGTGTYALAVPVDGESFSTAMLLAQQDGELTAEGYPTNFTAGQAEPLTVQLTNSENAKTSYTVVTAVERVTATDSRVRIDSQSELDRSRLTLGRGETARIHQDVAPDLTGEDVRLSYYVYRGEAPERPESATAYRDLHLWISVAPA